MTKKRFREIVSIKTIKDNQTGTVYTPCLVHEDFLNLINTIADENKELKQKLTIYRNLTSCSNCKYHNYDWYDDGDEFEVCDKGNNVTEGICKDWKELD